MIGELRVRVQEDLPGDKVCLPESCLEEMLRKYDKMGTSFPSPLVIMIMYRRKRIYAGVQEFKGDSISMPKRVMEFLGVSEGTKVMVQEKRLGKLNYASFHVPYKLAMDDQSKLIMETELNKFTTLTEGTMIPVCVRGTWYNIEVRKVEPKRLLPAAGIIADTDLSVDFTADVPESGMEVDEEEEETVATIETYVAAGTYEVTSGYGYFSTGTPTETCFSQLFEGRVTVPNGTVLSVGNVEFHLVDEEEEEALDKSKCKHCGRKVPPSAMMMHEMRCARLNTWCDICNCAFKSGTHHHCKTCGDVETPHHKEVHVHHECICGEYLTPIAKHTHVCHMRVEPCVYCGLEMARKDLNSHQEICGNKTDRCTTCNELFMRHMFHTCE